MVYFPATKGLVDEEALLMTIQPYHGDRILP